MARPGSAPCLAVLGVVFVLVASQLRITVDSDTIFPWLLHRDLHDWGGRLGAWNLPPAPCWFPDVGLVWLALACGASGVTAMRLSGIALLAIGTGGWAVASGLRAATSLALSAVLLLLPQLLAAGVQVEAHGGVIASMPWVLWLCARRRMALAAALVVLLTTSDGLALVLLVVPLSLSLRDRRGGIVVLAGAVGGGLGALLRPRPLLASYMDIDPTDSWRSLLALGRWVGSFAAHDPWTFVCVLVSLVTLLHAARRGAPRPTSFAPWSLASTVLALLVFGQFLDEGGARYVMPVLLAVVSAAVCHATRTMRLDPRRAGALAALLVGAAALLRATAPPAPPVPRSELLAPLERELAARSLRHGVADYWDAKLLTALSTEGTFLTALAPDRIAPYAWNASATWALRFPPTFLFVEPVREVAALRLYGAPNERVVLGDHVLLTYGTQIVDHFAPYLVDYGRPGSTGTFAARYGAAAPPLAYRGPGAMLPPGRYRFSLERRADSSASGSYRLRVGRRARSEGSWPKAIDLDVPRAAPLLVEIEAAPESVLAVVVTRLE